MHVINWHVMCWHLGINPQAKKACAKAHYLLSTSHYPLITFYFSLFTLLLIGCQQTDTSWQRVQDAGVLRVGVDPTYPPFALANETAVFGIDPDLARALGEQLGVTVEFSLFGYDGLYDALGTKQVDILISGMVIVPERTRDFAYSDPYFNAGELLVVPEGETEITEMRDLKGRSLAVELGAQGHVEATVWERNLSDLTVMPMESPDVALTAVLDGTADAALADAISVRLFLARHEGITAVSPPITTDPFAIVVRAEDETLLEKINEALAQFEKSGQLNEIIQNGFQP